MSTISHPTNGSARLPCIDANAHRQIKVAIIDPAGVAPKILGPLFAGQDLIDARFADLLTDPGEIVAVCCNAGVLVDPRGENGENADLWSQIVDQWGRLSLPAVILSVRHDDQEYSFASVKIMPAASSAMLVGALLGLAADEQQIRALEGQRQRAARLGDSIGTYLAAVDSELRLAARLQREFLPPVDCQIGPLGIASMFRPSNWVSGDIFDYFSIDSEHVGFYLADVMGHGVAAGLLTMYVKQIVRPVRQVVDGSEIIPPSEVLTSLNTQLCAQRLHESQFITAVYGVFNLKSLTLDYAVAGHPPIIRMESGGHMQELAIGGTLLGFEEDEIYVTQTVNLNPGDRIIVYSDGMELVLMEERNASGVVWKNGIAEVLRREPGDMLVELADQLDRVPGSLMRSDDVSLLMFEVQSAT